MSLQLVKEDITKIKVDAIVNPTDNCYSGSGGIDQQVHRAAGSELDKECKKLALLNVSNAEITKAYNLKTAKYIIHTCGPKYIDGQNNEESYLRKCYESVLEVAKENNIESIAMPLISTGAFGYPKSDAKFVAMDVCNKFLECNDMDIYLLIQGQNTWNYSYAIFEDIVREVNNNGIFFSEKEKQRYQRINGSDSVPFTDVSSLDDMEDFNSYLRRIMKEKKMDEYAVRKASNLTKQAFNRIFNDGVEPRRENVLALAMGLKLDLDETKNFVEMAGYSFGKRKIDIIVAACINRGFYDVVKLNDFLLMNNQDISLGSK